MARSTTQISANISVETKKRLERYVRARGLKKGFLIESALLHHIAALEALPADVIVPARLIVSRSSGERVIDLIEQPPAPTKAMEALFDRDEAEAGRLD